jgi:hypothetical protein
VCSSDLKTIAKLKNGDKSKQKRDGTPPATDRREKQKRDSGSSPTKWREKQKSNRTESVPNLREQQKSGAYGFPDSGVGRGDTARLPQLGRPSGMAQAVGLGIAFGATTGIALVAGVFYFGERGRARGQERCEDNRPLLGTDDFSRS